MALLVLDGLGYNLAPVKLFTLERLDGLDWCALCISGVFGVVYDGYLSNAEDEPEGTTPVIIKTVKGERTLSVYHTACPIYLAL